MISIARSIGTSRNVWRVPLVGHETSSARIASARPRPIVQARGLPPKLEPVVIVRYRETTEPSAPGSSTRILAPIAARLVRVPTSLTVSQWLP